MKHILTLATLVFATACFGQVPDHAPSNGLVAWWPLYGNVEDAFGSLHGVSVGGVAVDGPAGLEDRAIALPGEEDFIDLPTGEVNEEQGLTLAFWTWLDNPEGGNAPLVDRPDISNNIWSLDYQQSNQLVHFITRNDDGTGYHNLADWAPPQAQWCHVATVYRAQTGTKELHVNGTLVSADNAPLEGFTMPTLRLGEVAEGIWNSNCRFSEVGLWQRDLGQDEIFGLYEAGLPIEGCTNGDACNFNPDAVVDNGTCASCEQLQTACLEGTVWSEQLGGCIVANVSDTDFDGCVGINDFLIHLSNFGAGCGPELTWSCGDLLEYQGYDYETVQIGEQCWFAENLRSESYENGDEIPVGLSDEEWSSTTSGAMAVYGEGLSSCNTQSPDGDACDPNWSLAEYGRLYNWYAVDDVRGLCPSGWHVPSDEEWMTMEMILGMSESEANDMGFRGTDQGAQMKTEFGWFGGGAGTNSSGFSGLPGGYRSFNGSFGSAGIEGGWMIASLDGSNPWRRFLYDYSENVFRNSSVPQFGLSVRCIQDSE